LSGADPKAAMTDLAKRITAKTSKLKLDQPPKTAGQ